MNDQQNPYDPYYQPQIIGYDEYGQPVYQQPQQYDPYAQQPPQHPQQPRRPQQPQQPRRPQQPQGQDQGYGYDPYAQPQQYDPYGRQQAQQPQGQGYGYEGYGYDTGQQPAVVDTSQQWNIPQQPSAPAEPPAQAPETGRAPEQGRAAVPGQRGPAPDRDYRTEQFSFIEEPDEDSEDVIDWLKFSESRSERREEAKRRGRNRVVALVVVFALAVAGGVGYLWYAGKLPGLSDTEKKNSTATGPQKRDVIVVHLHNTKKKGTSTVLLVDNTTTKQGTTVLLPNSLSVANDDGTATTLGKSVEDDGSTGTREAVGTLLGAKVTGTWRLDTPYLENLVELVGNIDLTTDTDVPGAKKGEAPLVKKGENQTLNGRAAVAYATYLGPGEAEAKQLQRFGQVMQGILKKFPDDPRAATVTVETLAQILDPSLRESDLAASLAKLAEHAKGGDYRTALLPVQQDGTLTAQAAESVVKDVLGGRVTAPDKDAAVRVGIKNATGKTSATEKARIDLVNGGYSVLDGGKADTESASRVTYADEVQKAKAAEVAKTLGLPSSAVKKGARAPNADVSVVLGKDYETE
ncbi:LCP family protein [Streptomyces sp. ISL-1]|uniref:LCP family protein n=1 Tax=Streptomyces sp. ISL-1 TaxID=2817657 RepID=UPI001BEB292A|nr:LCP family protein [Streptomyces sp. ISL-1]MBT2391621.1 LCP family protein [Streptomyces sp. ISL-1]